MNFKLLNHRSIIDVLIGDVKVYGEYSMPYCSGPNLCEISTMFGFPKSYVWRGQNLSRWEYMRDLLTFTEKNNKTSELLSYMFAFSRFEGLRISGTQEQIKDTCKNIINGAISKINETLFFSGCQLQIVKGQFVIAESGETVIVEAPKIQTITYQYIQELPDRIKDDISNKDYDSVVTKSRTLLEEVMIFIIEKKTKERYRSKGDLMKIYTELKDLIGIKQRNEWDNRVNDLLSGINKIVDAIGKMRNMNSDAHGVGISRIGIKEREARLIASSAMMVSEYILSIYQRDREG